MIDYIKGNIAELTPTEVVIECNEIGYIASISLQTYSELEGKEKAKLYLHHILREDEELYYGFSSKEERSMFRLLINVSGVGAATARMMLSSLTCEEIRQAILAEDVNKIKSVKGIGLKSAQKVIIELKDKISKGAGFAENNAIFVQNSATVDEATTALIMLGFTKSAVQKAVASIIKKNPESSVESIIKQALQML